MSNRFYTSTSKKPPILDFFSYSPYKTDIVFKIEANGKNGASVEDMASYKEEAEVLYKPGSKFKVRKVRWKNRGDDDSKLREYVPGEIDKIPENAEFIIELEEI